MFSIPFTLHSALQNVKLESNKVKVIASFNTDARDIDFTPTNDILLATGNSRLGQIKAWSNKVTDSVYCEDTCRVWRVHVTKYCRVIVNSDEVVVIIDIVGNHLTRYEKDKNNRHIFSYITFITSTINGNIFVADKYDRKVCDQKHRYHQYL